MFDEVETVHAVIEGCIQREAARVSRRVHLSVIIPAFNESERMCGFLRVLREYLDGAFEGAYEVILVDDGSSDGTVAMLEEMQRAWPELRNASHTKNLGKGAALQTGVLGSSGELVLLCDADGAAAIEDEGLLRAAVEMGADIAVGSRSGGVSVERRPLRRLAGRCFAACVRRLFRLSLTDTQCGFKMLRGDMARSLFAATTERGYLIDVELLLLARQVGYSVVEVPVAWREIPGSKLSLWKEAGRTISGLWRLHRRARTMRRGCQSHRELRPATGPHAKGLARARPQGLTLIELLVSIAIVGMLMGLLIPAVFSARESARRTQCQNHLRQIAMAVLAHQSQHGHYPTGGWTYTWVGDPDRGFGEKQPGGWIYNTLPYIEGQSLRDLGQGEAQERKKAALARLSQSPLDVFHCPSRDGPSLSPYEARLPPRNAVAVSMVAKSDYAINAGDWEFGGLGPGPASLGEADRGEFQWPNNNRAAGISFQRSLVRPAQVLDGTSKTYLAGEKSIAGGRDLGHDQSMYTGYDYDVFRWTDWGLARDGSGDVRSFGGPHPHGANFAFADGSVRMIRFGIELRVHRALGNRQDGAPTELPAD